MRAHMYVCAHTRVCVQGHQWWPCHAVPCHAKLSREQAEQGQFLLVLGRSRPLRSGVTQPLLLGWGCPVQPYPRPRHRAGQPGCSGDPAPAHCGPWHGPVTAPVSHGASQAEGDGSPACVPTALAPGCRGVPSPRAAPDGGLWPSQRQTRQGSRWHGRLAPSQLLMTLPVINEGVADAPAGPLACSTCHHGGAQHQSQQDAQQDHARPPDMANRGGDGGTAWAPIT